MTWTCGKVVIQRR